MSEFLVKGTIHLRFDTKVEAASKEEAFDRATEQFLQKGIRGFALNFVAEDIFWHGAEPITAKLLS